jgi:hypothetical protein
MLDEIPAVFLFGLPWVPAVDVCSYRRVQDQMNAFIGASGAPPPTVVMVVLGTLLIVNAVLYIFLMHVLYTVLLRSMGFTMSSLPASVERAVFKRSIIQ